MRLPEADKHSYSREYLETSLAGLMGGRIAEEIFMHHLTTGAGNDIERATETARKMVCEWGMSELGPLSFGKKEEQIFLGREIAQHRDYSEATAVRIDEEVRRIVGKAYDRARKIIEERSDALERIAKALLEREVLDGDEIRALIEGRELGPFHQPTTTGDRGQTQQVVRPDSGRRLPGLVEGERPQPA
jgi:cell division protease FtsH